MDTKQVKPQTGHCNACSQTRELLTDTLLQESICRVCRSYDVTRSERKAGRQAMSHTYLTFKAGTDSWRTLLDNNNTSKYLEKLSHAATVYVLFDSGEAFEMEAGKIIKASLWQSEVIPDWASQTLSRGSDILMRAFEHVGDTLILRVRDIALEYERYGCADPSPELLDALRLAEAK